MPIGEYDLRIPLWHGRLLRGQAAIDDEAGAGHKRGVVGGEEDDALGDVGRGAEPADRVGRQGNAARRLSPQDPAMSFNFANVLAQQKDNVRARQFAQYALSLKPDYAAAQQLVA